MYIGLNTKTTKIPIKRLILNAISHNMFSCEAKFQVGYIQNPHFHTETIVPLHLTGSFDLRLLRSGDSPLRNSGN